MKKCLGLFICIGLFLNFSYAQTNAISGTVKDSKGKPLVGANLLIDALSIVNTTDSSGNFTIQIPASADKTIPYILKVSYLGYYSQSHTLNLTSGNTTLNLSLEENAIAINTIEVSATKTGETNVMETPIAITPFSGKLLEYSGADYLQEFINNVPGLSTYSLDEGYNSFQIRGISSIIGDSPVGYYLDDMPYVSPGGAQILPDINPFDLERIEALRGPQGTLYGASSAAGLIRVLTKDADPSQFSAKADLSLGTVDGGGDSYTAQAAVNLPLIKDQLAVRLVGGHKQLGGFIDNSTLGLENLNDYLQSSFRGKILYRPNNQLTIKGSYWWQEAEMGALSNADDDYDHATPFEENYDNNFNLVNAAIEYKFPNMTLYSTSSYIDLNNSRLNGSSVTVYSDGDFSQKTFNQEIRLNSENEGPFNWLAGLFYLDATHHNQVDLGFALPDGSISVMPFVEEGITSRQFAAFGELYYRFLNDKAQASLGLRYFNDDRALEDLFDPTIEVLTSLGLDAKRSETYTKLSPRLNLSFTPSDKSLIYATVANGFRSGIIQSGGNVANSVSLGLPTPFFVDEENIWSYELGSKIELAEKQISLETAVYYNDWSDMQIITVNFLDQSVYVLYENVPEGATAYGVEWNILYSNTWGLDLGFSGNLNSTEYDSDLPGISGIRKGNRVDYVPATTLSASAGYAIPIGENFIGKFYSNLQHNSPSPETNGEYREGDPITLLNGRIGVDAKNWGIFLYGKNLLNEKGSLYRSQRSPVDRRIRPLNFGINLKLNFQ